MIEIFVVDLGCLESKVCLKAIKVDTLSKDESKLSLIRMGVSNKGIAEVCLIGLPLHENKLIVLFLRQDTLLVEFLDLILGLIKFELEARRSIRVDLLIQEFLVALAFSTDVGMLSLEFFSEILPLKLTNLEGSFLSHGIRKFGLLCLKSMSCLNDCVN